MKRILGLDLGTNSIGWAVVEESEKVADAAADDTASDISTVKDIIAAGSRIIPMDAAAMGDYEKGNLRSSASERTDFRGMRRLYERSTLRRERLLRVLNVMGFLPEHFRDATDFDERPGKFKDYGEPLLAYAPDAAGKNKFIFTSSFHEMLEDFRAHQPALVEGGKLVPYDWTIYYLRKKALTRPVTKEELAWIILNFNTKRGYYQRSEEQEDEEKNAGKVVEYAVLRVAKVERKEADKKRHGYYWYETTYENGATQRSLSPAEPRRAGDMVEVIITTTLDKDGRVKTDREGRESVTLRSPKDGDWTLMKKRTEHALDASKCTPGEFIYDHLLSHPDAKVRGKLIHTIERRYYRNELTRILDKQREFMPELRDGALFSRCVRELYRTNSAHAESLSGKGFTELFVSDIIFYHRPLKSKKSLISDCSFEVRHWRDRQTGEVHASPLKCTPQSHPLFQEFRLWQFVSNLKILKRGSRSDADVTSSFLPGSEARAELFDWLREKKKIDQEQLLKYKPFGLGKNDVADYRWNYVEDKSYPCDETAYEISRRLKKIQAAPLTAEDMRDLWHIETSVSDPVQNQGAGHLCGEARHRRRSFCTRVQGLGARHVRLLRIFGESPQAAAAPHAHGQALESGGHR